MSSTNTTNDLISTNIDNSTNTTPASSVIVQNSIDYFAPLPLTNLEIVLMTTLFPTFFLFYCIVLKLLLKKGPDFRNSYYTLAIGLGLNDICMLIYSFYVFLLDIVGYSFLGPAMENFMFFVFQSNCGWYSTQMYSFAIAINRFLAITHFDFYRIRVTVKSSLVLMVIIPLLSLCWTTPCLVICGYRYVPYFKSHLPRIFESQKCLLYTQDVYKPVDQFFTISISAGSFVLYTIAALYSIYKRKRFTGDALTASYTREMKLLMQGFVLMISLCAVCGIHYMSPPALLQMTTNWVYCSLNPMVYVALDQRLRSSLIQTISGLFVKLMPMTKQRSNIINLAP